MAGIPAQNRTLLVDFYYKLGVPAFLPDGTESKNLQALVVGWQEAPAYVNALVADWNATAATLATFPPAANLTQVQAQSLQWRTVGKGGYNSATASIAGRIQPGGVTITDVASTQSILDTAMTGACNVLFPRVGFLGQVVDGSAVVPTNLNEVQAELQGFENTIAAYLSGVPFNTLRTTIGVGVAVNDIAAAGPLATAETVPLAAILAWLNTNAGTSVAIVAGPFASLEAFRVAQGI